SIKYYLKKNLALEHCLKHSLPSKIKEREIVEATWPWLLYVLDFCFLRWLNKAALVVGKELNEDGSSSDPWRLCSIQQVEELKCLLKIMPIWVTGTIAYVAMAELNIFPISQALKIDRHLGPNLEIPPSSIIIVTMLTFVVAILFYDLVLCPTLAKITKQEGGITSLQRIGIGHFFGIVATVVAGVVEQKRRGVAISQGGSDGVAPMSIMWLAPQFMLLGLTQMFSIVGHTEHFNKEAPNKMRSIGNSLVSLQTAGGNYLGTFIVNIIHNFSGNKGQPDWLDSDLNKGRLEYFYYVIAGVFNKDALIQDDELDAQGQVTNSWSLCSIEQVEEVK
ncbi:Protein NRT1/ PTR FAMILY 2.13, partial [Mucuna pruriens]